jgi:hypothetical protein
MTFGNNYLGECCIAEEQEFTSLHPYIIGISQTTEYNIEVSEMNEYSIEISETTEYSIGISNIGGG